MKITGQKAMVFIDMFEDSSLLTTGTTVKNNKYFVIQKGATSSIPVAEGMFFIAPDSTTQITLVTGDKLFKINEERFCKTSVSFEFSMGSVDVGDDCDPGATISDGIVSVSGSLAGFFKYNDETQDFDNITDSVVNHFVDIVEDDGAGNYVIKPRIDNQIYLLTLFNSGAAQGNTENWLFCPINISSMSMSLGNADPQSREISFAKGEGKAAIYKVPVHN